MYNYLIKLFMTSGFITLLVFCISEGASANCRTDMIAINEVTEEIIALDARLMALLVDYSSIKPVTSKEVEVVFDVYELTGGPKTEVEALTLVNAVEDAYRSNLVSASNDNSKTKYTEINVIKRQQSALLDKRNAILNCEPY
jgi:hypothetical protein